MSFQLPKMTRRQRAIAALLGGLILVGGVVYSIDRLGISLDDVRLAPLLINLVLIQPAILALAVVTLRLSGRAVGSAPTFPAATRAVGYANFAEILPLPGGALVRGAALIQAGANLGGAASIVTTTAFLSLSLIVAIAAAALMLTGTPEALPVMLVALVGLIALSWRISRRAGAALTLAIVAIRLLTVTASAISVWLALRAIGAPAPVSEALIISVSGTLGSVVTIVPAGLGISESIAAGLATMTGIAPPAAFLALALHRTLALVASLGAAFWPKGRETT
ncbi:MAG: hypothetical protein HKN98_17180 [Silicimonas sp.]|nr:hypothetical protein [Silicimonas sp.]